MIIKNILKKNSIVFLTLTLLVVLVYANALPNEFTSDDMRGILHNKNLGEFNLHVVGFVQGVLHDLIFQIWGRLPAPYRAVNIIFHILNSWLVFILVAKTMKKRDAAFIAAAIFCVHPILVESITWISGGIYALYSFFFLLSFVFYLKAKEKSWWLIFSLLAFLAALISSEKAIILPLVLFVWELSEGKLKRNWFSLVPHFLLSGFWFLYFVVLGKITERISDIQTHFYSSGDNYNWFLELPAAISSYLELIFYPKDLTLYHTEMAFTNFEFALRTSVLIVFLVILVVLLKKNLKLFFWLSFFLITLFPVLTPLPVAWIVAERYVYLGSIGIFVVIALAFKTLMERSKPQWLAYLALAIFLASFGARTIMRNVDWKNEDNLWLATVKVSPSGENIHNNLGDVYGRRGDKLKAIEEFKKAILINPRYADAMHNLANTYMEIGKTEKAIFWYAEAIKNNPLLWQSYQNLGAIYYELGELEVAEQLFTEAVKLRPDNDNLKANLEIIRGMINQ